MLAGTDFRIGCRRLSIFELTEVSECETSVSRTLSRSLCLKTVRTCVSADSSLIVLAEALVKGGGCMKVRSYAFTS
jgi:hypothetical protein